MKFQTKFFTYFFTFALSLALMQCGGSSSGTSTTTDGTTVSATPQYDTIDDLPSANGEVETSSTSSLVTGDSLYLASTGLPLGSTDETAFDNTSSQASCEVFNMFKESVKLAGEGDTILCYIQLIFSTIEAGTNTTLQDSLGDIYYRNTHVIGLEFPESDDDEGGGPDKVAIKVVKDANGIITNFTMQSCEDGTQHDYLLQTIDPTTGEFSMEMKSVFSGSHGNFTSTGSNSVDVSGFVNASGLSLIHI